MAQSAVYIIEQNNLNKLLHPKIEKEKKKGGERMGRNSKRFKKISGNENLNNFSCHV